LIVEWGNKNGREFTAVELRDIILYSAAANPIPRLYEYPNYQFVYTDGRVCAVTALDRASQLMGIR